MIPSTEFTVQCTHLHKLKDHESISFSLVDIKQVNDMIDTGKLF
jgi:hypothetical protein